MEEPTPEEGQQRAAAPVPELLVAISEPTAPLLVALVETEGAGGKIIAEFLNGRSNVCETYGCCDS